MKAIDFTTIIPDDEYQNEKFTIMCGMDLLFDGEGLVPDEYFDIASEVKPGSKVRILLEVENE